MQSFLMQSYFLFSYKYLNLSSGSFVSSNTLPLIRHSAFHRVAECFSSDENYFVFFKKTWHQDFAPFWFQVISAAWSAITFQNCFHRHFLKTDYQIKCWLRPFLYPLCRVLFYCFCLFLQFLFLGFTESTFASESGDSVPVVCQRSCACLC